MRSLRPVCFAGTPLMLMCLGTLGLAAGADVPPPLLASCITATCPRDTVVATFQPVVRRFTFTNCGTATEAFDYTLDDSQNWGADQSGTVTLLPGEVTRLAIECTPPATFVNSCQFRTFIALTVRAAGSATVLHTCSSRVELPSLSAPVCPPPIVASPGDTVHLTLWATNPNPNVRRYTVYTDDYLQWMSRTSASIKIDPGGSVAIERNLIVPLDAACGIDGVSLLQRISCDPIPNNYPTCYTAVDVVVRNPVMTPQVTVLGDHPWAEYASAVLAAGDLNGDGAGDFATVRRRYWGGPPPEIRVFFGGALADTSPDAVLAVSAAVAAGDVNGDGNADVIAGESDYSEGSANPTGRVLLFFGGLGFDATPDFTISAPASAPALGATVAFVGDLNADGHGDLAVRASTDRVLLYFGGPQFDGSADLTIIQPVQGGVFGYSIAGGEDVNGDGYADLVVGGAASQANPTPGAFVYFGGPLLDTIPDLTFISDPWAGLGTAVALCDVDADGTADILASAPNGDDDTGHVYVYKGGALLDATPDWTLSAGALGYFGWSLAAGFDLDGDGFKDVAVGGYQDALPGHVRIYRGGPGFEPACSVLLRGTQNDDHFGAALSMGPDVTGDGHADLIVGAPTYTGPTGRGAGHVYSGALAVDAAPPAGAEDARRTTVTIDEIVSQRQVVEIRYRVSGAASAVRTEIFDVAGRRIRRLDCARRTPGTYRIAWDRRDDAGAPAVRGVYILRLWTESANVTRKIVLR